MKFASFCCRKQAGRASVLARRSPACILRLASTLALPKGSHSIFSQQELVGGVRFAVAWIVTMGAAVWASGETVTLKDEVYVKGPKVLLGDVAIVEGADADYLKTIEIAPAALPGATRRLNAALVRSQLTKAGVDESAVEFRGSRHVMATTMHLAVTRGMIAEGLREYIRHEMPWEPDATIVEVMSPPSDYVVSDGDVDFRWVPNPQYRYLGLGSFRGEILVDGRVEKTFYTKANIATYEQVVVAATAIRRGDALSSANLRLENRELSALKGALFFSLADVKGYVAKSTIFQGQVITPRKVAAPVLVKRNQIVAVEITIGALTIRARARSLSQAAAGDLLRALNLRSKEEFAGVLRADGVLIVD